MHHYIFFSLIDNLFLVSEAIKSICSYNCNEKNLKNRNKNNLAPRFSSLVLISACIIMCLSALNIKTHDGERVDPTKTKSVWLYLFIVFNATFSNISAISWRPVLVVEEAGVPGENHRPWASNR
jgi:hypothetical protein